MLADFCEALCSLLLAILATLVTDSGGRKLTYIMMVPICNVQGEYGHCTVKQTYKNYLNNVVKVTNAYEFYWPSLTYPSQLWRILGHVMAGMLTIILG
jgi:hypothetical protein